MNKIEYSKDNLSKSIIKNYIVNELNNKGIKTIK